MRWFDPFSAERHSIFAIAAGLIAQTLAMAQASIIYRLEGRPALGRWACSRCSQRDTRRNPGRCLTRARCGTAAENFLPPGSSIGVGFSCGRGVTRTVAEVEENAMDQPPLTTAAPSREEASPKKLRGAPLELGPLARD